MNPRCWAQNPEITSTCLMRKGHRGPHTWTFDGDVRFAMPALVVESRVILTGSRAWYCPEVCQIVVARLSKRYPGLAISVGDCRSGVDKGIAKACRERGIPCDIFEADWKAYGKGAGPIRNRAMIDRGAILCVAIHPDLAGSLGTKDCVGQAIEAGIPVSLVSDDRVNPVRITSI
jgi:hypothetical protein